MRVPLRVCDCCNTPMLVEPVGFRAIIEKLTWGPWLPLIEAANVAASLGAPPT